MPFLKNSQYNLEIKKNQKETWGLFSWQFYMIPNQVGHLTAISPDFGIIINNLKQ